MGWRGLVRSSETPCVRLEDPTLLTGAGKYVDDLEQAGMAHVVFVRSPVAHGTITSIDVERRRGDAGRRRRVLGSRRGRPRPGPVPGLPDDAGRASTARSSPRTACASSATSWPPSSPRRGRRPSTPPRRSSSTTTRCPSSTIAGGRAGARRADRCSPSTAPTCASPPTFGDDVDPLEGADAVAEVDDGQPAARRRADGEQRHRRRARRADGGLTCWVSHQAPHAAHARHGAGARAGARRSCASCARGSAAGSARRPRCTSSTSSPRRRPGRSAAR